jgi:hypothetical protein
MLPLLYGELMLKVRSLARGAGKTPQFSGQWELQD